MTREEAIKKLESLKVLLPAAKDEISEIIKLIETHWISVKNDLPYKHKELLHSDHETKLVLTVDTCGSINTDFMSIYEGTWCWWNDPNTVYWHPISDLDKNLL